MCLADHHRTGVFSSGTVLHGDFLRNKAYLRTNLPLLVAISARVRAWYLSRGLGFHTADAPQDRMTLYLPVTEMRGLRESDPDWDAKQYTLPPLTWLFMEDEDECLKMND